MRAARVERARKAGAVGLIATLDWSFSFGRDWGSPHIPERMTLRESIRLAPEAMSRLPWLYSWLRTGHIPDLTVPNLPRAASRRPRSSAPIGSGCSPSRRPGTTWPGWLGLNSRSDLGPRRTSDKFGRAKARQRACATEMDLSVSSLRQTIR